MGAVSSQSSPSSDLRKLSWPAAMNPALSVQITVPTAVSWSPIVQMEGGGLVVGDTLGCAVGSAVAGWVGVSGEALVGGAEVAGACELGGPGLDTGPTLLGIGLVIGTLVHAPMSEAAERQTRMHRPNAVMAADR